MDRLHLSDYNVMGFGSNGVAEVLLESETDLNEQPIVSLAVRYMKNEEEAIVWLNVLGVMNIIEWLQRWLDQQTKMESK